MIMKKIDSEIPEQLLQQVDILNSLYELILKQQSLLEKEDYESFFTTKSELDEINKVIQQKREQLFIIENTCDIYQYNISKNTQKRINEIIAQLDDLMKKVQIVENQNCCMLELSQQKIGEALNKFSKC